MTGLTKLKSSSDADPPGPDATAGPAVTVATGLRLRGAGGRLTARLVPRGIDQLGRTPSVLVGRAGGGLAAFEVEEYTVYSGKVVVKLRGVDSVDRARDLVGKDILLPCNRLVDLPEGTYYIFELVGLMVETVDGRRLGTVRDIVETGGTPLLAIEPHETAGRGGEETEILLPVARSICRTIDARARRIVVEPPEGLLELYGL